METATVAASSSFFIPSPPFDCAISALAEPTGKPGEYKSGPTIGQMNECLLAVRLLAGLS
jgi:hypothetical protein